MEKRKVRIFLSGRLHPPSIPPGCAALQPDVETLAVADSAPGDQPRVYCVCSP